MKIGLLEPLGVTEELVSELAAPAEAAGHTFVKWDDRAKDAEELIRRSADCDAVMIANTPYPDAVIRASEKLRFIDVAFTGVDHVGAAACREKDIVVSNAAGYSTQTVAELAVGMAIALLRRLPECGSAVRGGGTNAGLCGDEIAGKTVGIVGTGHIGIRTAQLFQAFGARVIAYSRSASPAAMALGIPYVTLPELMRESDIVSLHIPANDSTRGMIGRAMIAMMKPTALLINCARGPVADSAALADALNAGRIAGAGVDVFDAEPPLNDSEPLLHAKNTILTPHVGFLSHEAMERRARIAFANLYAWLDGKPENVCRL